MGTELRSDIPGVTHAGISPAEFAILRDTVGDLVPRLPGAREAAMLGELATRGNAIREEVPRVADLAADIASHTGPQVTILDMPETLVDNVGPTPTQYAGPDTQRLVIPDLYRGLFLGIAGWYGYGYASQQNGIVHNDVVPLQTARLYGHNANAYQELGLHTEEASFNLGEGRDISPDFLTLYFFRNPSRTPTVVSIPEWSEVPAETQDLLFEDWYDNRTNPAQGGEENDPACAVSVLYGPSNDPWIRLNTATPDTVHDPRHAKALTEFILHLKSRKMNICLKAGQLMLLDNRRVLHGRPPFEEPPRYDGMDRWQRRVVVSNDAARIKAYEKSRERIVDSSILR